MSKNLRGGGAFVWKVPRLVTAFGGYELLSRAIAKWRLTHVLIKICDGVYPYNYDFDNQIDYAAELVSILKLIAPECEIWGWGFVYGDDPIGEAEIAISRIRELGIVEGFAVNAEAHYKIGDKSLQAKQYMGTLRYNLGDDFALALSSYRVPSYHPIPWREFLRRCDIAMPQVYWVYADPIEEMERTIDEYTRLYSDLGFERPTIYTGSFYGEGGWLCRPDQVTSFISYCQGKDLTWNSWEMWEFAIQHPELLQAMLSVYVPPDDDVVVPPPPPEPPEMPVNPKWVGKATGHVNIRTEPGAVDPDTDIGTLLKGSQVPVIREKEGYYYIAGWVHKNWIKKL